MDQHEHEDNNMSVIGDGEPLKRVHLPVDFTGPICALCAHRRVPKDTTGDHDWQCMAPALVVLNPAETNPVTGEVHEAQYMSRPRCWERNNEGDCADFDVREPAPSEAVQEEDYERAAVMLGTELGSDGPGENRGTRRGGGWIARLFTRKAKR